MSKDRYETKMILWAKEHNLETELYKEILHNPLYDTWVANDALVKRFGYFVLEHDDMLIERLENEEYNVEM